MEMEDDPRKSKSSKKDKMKKSGVRTKFLIESLRNDYYELRQENEKLRALVSAELPQAAASQILSECFDVNATVKQSPRDIDTLASQMAGAGVDTEDDDDNDAVGY